LNAIEEISFQSTSEDRSWCGRCDFLGSLTLLRYCCVVLTARRGGPATPRQPGLTNGHVNGALTPDAAARPAGSQAESPLFSSPAPRRGLFQIYYFPGRGVKYCDQHVHLSVGLSVCWHILKTTSPNFNQIFCTCYLRSWLGPLLTAVRYVDLCPVLWMTSCLNTSLML